MYAICFCAVLILHTCEPHSVYVQNVHRKQNIGHMHNAQDITYAIRDSPTQNKGYKREWTFQEARGAHWLALFFSLLFNVSPKCGENSILLITSAVSTH